MNLNQARQVIAPRARGKPSDDPLEKTWAKLAWSTVTAKPENPLIEEYVQPNNTQNPQPPLQGTQIPMYVPTDNKSTMHPDKHDGKGEPIHTMEMKTRKQIMCTTSSAMSGIYKKYLYAWIALFATIILAVFVNAYLAAIPAYLAGHFWSEKCVDVAWEVQWLKGKTLISAA